MTYTLKTTKTFDDWLKSLKDLRAYATIQRRLDRVEAGNLGDHKSVGDGISEMRIHVGAGYRLYYTTAGKSSSCWLAATKAANKPTSPPRRN